MEIEVNKSAVMVFARDAVEVIGSGGRIACLKFVSTHIWELTFSVLGLGMRI